VVGKKTAETPDVKLKMIITTYEGGTNCKWGTRLHGPIPVTTLLIFFLEKAEKMQFERSNFFEQKTNFGHD